MAVFDPERKRTARGEQRQQALLRAASTVFARTGYHDATTNAIAAEAGVSPATLYQFFPNKEALADAITASHAREMAAEERSIDPTGALPFADAITELLHSCLRFHSTHPEFHTLLMEAPLSPSARDEKAALSSVFSHFIADRLRAVAPSMPRAEAHHHGHVALLIFKGIIGEYAHAKPALRSRLKQSLVEATLRYLAPLIPAQKATAPLKRGRSQTTAS